MLLEYSSTQLLLIRLHALGIPSISELFCKGCSYISLLFLKEILRGILLYTVDYKMC